MRTLTIENPDGQRTSADVELRSVDVELRSGRLLDTLAPGRDVLRVKGALRQNGLSPRDEFAGRELGMRLAVGDPRNPLEIVIPPNDDRWKSRRGGRTLAWRTRPDEYPRVRLTVKTRDATLNVRVSHFDYPGLPGRVDLSYDSDTDHGVDEKRWEPLRNPKKWRLAR